MPGKTWCPDPVFTEVSFTLVPLLKAVLGHCFFLYVFTHTGVNNVIKYTFHQQMFIVCLDGSFTAYSVIQLNGLDNLSTICRSRRHQTLCHPKHDHTFALPHPDESGHPGLRKGSCQVTFIFIFTRKCPKNTSHLVLFLTSCDPCQVWLTCGSLYFPFLSLGAFAETRPRGSVRRPAAEGLTDHF